MTRRVRLALFLIAGAGTGLVLLAAFAGLPDFGARSHPYGARAVAAGLKHNTSNIVASVNFDLRALDTLGEEFVLFTAATGAVVLLRRLHDEERDEGTSHRFERDEVFETLRLATYLAMPVTVLIGAYVVAHGHLSPGGGFQGGVVMSSGVLMLYLGADVSALERLSPRRVFDVGEAVAAGMFAVVGLVGLVTGAGFLADSLPRGTMGDLLSAGTVPLLNVAVGVEVGCGIVIVLEMFLEQALLIRSLPEGDHR
jgi:multicomponent Na+:H+ antiporter subunit B